MSLLSVTVRKAEFVGAQTAQNNSYVTLKLQNVKTTTVVVKGSNPCWEQDFLFETSDLNQGLLIEVWCKGMLWDRALGYCYIPLHSIMYEMDDGSNENWVSLDGDLVMQDGEVIATKNPTGHSVLINCHFEQPFDAEGTDGAELQRKLERLNTVMEQDARRRLQYSGHSGYSEDSDYTSERDFPTGQHPNSSASQFRGLASQMRTPGSSRENSWDDGGRYQHGYQQGYQDGYQGYEKNEYGSGYYDTPNRSLESSRENSYEREDGTTAYQQGFEEGRRRYLLAQQRAQFDQTVPMDDFGYQDGGSGQAEGELDLYYNSRPRGQEKPSRRRRKNWEEDGSNWYGGSASDPSYGKPNYDGPYAQNYGQTDYTQPGFEQTDFNQTDYKQTDFKQTDYKQTDFKQTDYNQTDYKAHSTYSTNTAKNVTNSNSIFKKPSFLSSSKTAFSKEPYQDTSTAFSKQPATFNKPGFQDQTNSFTKPSYKDAYSDQTYQDTTYPDQSYQDTTYQGTSTSYEDAGYQDASYQGQSYQSSSYQDPSYQDPNASYQEPAATYQEPNATYQDPSYQDSSYQTAGYQDPSYQDPSYQDPSYQATPYEDTSYQTQGYQDGTYQDTGYPNTEYQATAYQQGYGTQDYATANKQDYQQGIDYKTDMSTTAAYDQTYKQESFDEVLAKKTRDKSGRRPSLERQTTLYDDSVYNDSAYYDASASVDQSGYDQNGTAASFYEEGSVYPYQDKRSGREQEDRQWDSGGASTYVDESSMGYSSTGLYASGTEAEPVADPARGAPSTTAATSTSTASASVKQASWGKSEYSEYSETSYAASTMDVPEEEESFYSPRQGMSYDEDYGVPSAAVTSTALSSASASVTATGEDLEANGSSSRRRPMVQQSATASDDYEYSYGYGASDTTSSVAAVTSASAVPTTSASVPATPAHSVDKAAASLTAVGRSSSVDRDQTESQDYYQGYDQYAGYEGYEGYSGYNEDYNYAYQSQDGLQTDQAAGGSTAAASWGGANSYYYSCQEDEYYQEQDHDASKTQPTEGATPEPKDASGTAPGTAPASGLGTALEPKPEAKGAAPEPAPGAAPATTAGPTSGSGLGSGLGTGLSSGLGSALGFGTALGGGLGTALGGGLVATAGAGLGSGLGAAVGLGSALGSAFKSKFGFSTDKSKVAPQPAPEPVRTVKPAVPPTGSPTQSWPPSPTSPVTSQAERDAERDASSMPQHLDDETQATQARKRQFQQRGSRTRGLDSLESKDDDMRESFETAISSVSHTFPTPSSTATTEAYHQDAYHQEAYNQDAYNQDGYLQDGYSQEAATTPPSLVGPAIPSRRPTTTAGTTLASAGTSTSIATSLASTTLPSMASAADPHRFLRSQDSVESYGDEAMEYSGYEDRYDHTHTTGSLDRGESILEEDEEYGDSPVPKTQETITPGVPTGSPPATLPPSGMGSLEEEAPPETDADLLRKTSLLEHDVELPKKLEAPLQPTQTQPPRPKMNARERWHWAYNRVVHQINVSD